MKLILPLPGPRILNLRSSESKIASLSSGKFVGMVADDAHEKNFHPKSKKFKEIPVISNVTHEQVMENYHKVKLDIKKNYWEEVSSLKGRKGYRVGIN